MVFYFERFAERCPILSLRPSTSCRSIIGTWLVSFRNEFRLAMMNVVCFVQKEHDWNVSNIIDLKEATFVMATNAGVRCWSIRIAARNQAKSNIETSGRIVIRQRVYQGGGDSDWEGIDWNTSVLILRTYPTGWRKFYYCEMFGTAGVPIWGFITLRNK